MAVVNFIHGSIEAEPFQTSSMANALTSLCHQFVWRFWIHAQRDEKRDFFYGLARFVKKEFDEEDIDRRIEEANSILESLQRRTGANVHDLQREFWEDTYTLLFILDDFFDDPEQS